jgi:hypothetical protein
LGGDQNIQKRSSGISNWQNKLTEKFKNSSMDHNAGFLKKFRQLVAPIRSDGTFLLIILIPR